MKFKLKNFIENYPLLRNTRYLVFTAGGSGCVDVCTQLFLKAISWCTIIKWKYCK